LKAKKEPPQDPNAPHTAIIIKMTLDSATYATMLIRELTKNPTSQIYQRELQMKFDKDHGTVNDDEELNELGNVIAEDDV